MGDKIDTRSVGLDIGLSFISWLTGAENLHYGYWDGLEVTAANLRAAQEAYTDKLFALLPDGPLRILDIGGGAGETARKLLALGHQVDIVVPSAFLAGRCRENAPAATVHECMFEAFDSDARFDLCLFSESFQYIPPAIALEKSMRLLAPGGQVIIADCFRTEAFRTDPKGAKVGGGHMLQDFRAVLSGLPLTVLSEEDVTDAVAPSVELEQRLFNVLGYGITRLDGEIRAKRPRLRWLIARVFRLALNDVKRARLAQRLHQQTRNAAAFNRYNRYLLMRLEPSSAA